MTWRCDRFSSQLCSAARPMILGTGRGRLSVFVSWSCPVQAAENPLSVYGHGHLSLCICMYKERIIY